MNLSERDLKHVWHPCSQMKDYESFPPIEVVSAKGSYLQLVSGKQLIDATSSWWCKSLGHGHPRLREALIKQAHKFEHVISANVCHEPLVQLSEKLASLTKHLSRIMYASDGSCAIEIAIKMALHAKQLQHQSERTKFACLENSYHGETGLAMSVSDVGLYREPYDAMLTQPLILKKIPYVSGKDDPLWNDCGDKWPPIEALLSEHASVLAGIIIEPILQGAGGMRIISQDFLKRLSNWAHEHDVYVIADEIMTSFGRTGTALASEHAHIKPDFVCVGKGLTAGWLPISATLTHDDIYQLFYDDYQTGKSFLHSHTYTGNPLAAAVAVETLTVLEDEDIYNTVLKESSYLAASMQEVVNSCDCLTNFRSIGFMAAADLQSDVPRAGYEVYKEATKMGALLRPLGNTIYWLPPLNSDRAVIDALRDITSSAISRIHTG